MKLTIIFNPVAGNANRPRKLIRLISYLEEMGHLVTVSTTTSQGDATKLARQAIKEGTETILVFGGDGTINEAIQGMADSTVPLAVYPAGTTNVWCKQVGMPSNPRRAAEIISAGPRHWIDLGRVGEHYFLLMVGIGFDGEVTHAIDLEQKRRLGKLSYVLAGLRVVRSFSGTNVKITLDPGSSSQREVSTNTNLLIFTNVERYAVMKLAQEAQIDDAQMELLIFHTTHLWSKVARTFSLVTNRSQHDSQIKRYRLREAWITANPSVAMQVDGDPYGRVGQAAVKIECLHRALQVVIPAHAPEKLFSQSRPSGWLKTRLLQKIVARFF
ncbi:MAG: diacylglycerol kinase family lipid kinase [Chloroflexi bacterium]|nr:diacylglycerol kinase family lipid kinase [Chloroflexota bacterium]